MRLARFEDREGIMDKEAQNKDNDVAEGTDRRLKKIGDLDEDK